MKKPPKTRTAVSIHQQFNTPHRLRGDGLSQTQKERIGQVSDPTDRARAEYFFRMSKAAFAIEQFIKRHDERQNLSRSPTLRPLCHQNGTPLFTTYQNPKEFLPALSSILSMPLGNYSICGWPSNGDVHIVEVKLTAAYAAGLVPAKPLVRLALFGRREEVLALGAKSNFLLQSQSLEVPLASAILLFAFKNTAEQEMKLARLLCSTCAYGEDVILWDAASKYLKAINEGNRPFF